MVKPPRHHCQLALAVAGGPDKRAPWCPGRRQEGQEGCQIALDPKETPHGLLAASDAVNVAHELSIRVEGQEGVGAFESGPAQVGATSTCALLTSACPSPELHAAPLPPGGVGFSSTRTVGRHCASEPFSDAKGQAFVECREDVRQEGHLSA
jgi:hypothetical protein